MDPFNTDKENIMYCKHCGKKLEHDIHNDEYAIYNGDIYCDTDCMLFDVDYGGVDVSSFSKEDWNSSINFDDNNENEMSIKDAMKILINHNKWRRDNHVPNKYEMVNPTDLGKAIDVAINALDDMIQNT